MCHISYGGQGFRGTRPGSGAPVIPALRHRHYRAPPPSFPRSATVIPALRHRHSREGGNRSVATGDSGKMGFPPPREVGFANGGNDVGVAVAAFARTTATHPAPNPPKLRHFSNFSDSWPCAVFGLAFAVSRDFHDVDRSVQQSSQAGPVAVCRPFLRPCRQAAGSASAA